LTDPERDETTFGRDIAVVGLAGRFPRARDLEAFWHNLRDGVEAVTFFSDEELLAAGVDPERIADPTYVKAGSVLDAPDEFDAGFFGYTASEAAILDPQQRLFLEHCWEALENAGYDPGRYPGLIGVYAGVAWNTYLLTQLTSRPELFAGGGGFQVFITNDKDFMATRVSYKLNLKGPSLVLQTSCSTSLVTIHLACLSLLNYECDMALAGGVTVKVPQVEGYTWLEGGLASPDGHCRAFDAEAQGTIFGSGVGVVVLKRLADAIADGDRIRAVIKGSAINNDGSVKVSYTAPSVEGQAEVIAAAQALAGIDADQVSYIECHGTGTSLGDPIEVAALTKVFRESTDRVGFCALGSVKTNLGHLDAAAGVAGFLKTVLALEHGQIPPSLNYSNPNPKIEFAASPFFVNDALRDWPVEAGSRRRAGVSSFGVGGTNAHVIVEEAPPVPAPAPSRAAQLLLLSARSPAALDAATERLAAALRDDPSLPLADVAYTLRAGRAVFRHRRAVVCRGREEAVAALSGAASITAADTQEPRQRPVIFLFPGQGAQHTDMARGLYREEPVFRQEIDRCADLLRPHLGLDLREALYPGPGTDSETSAQRLAHTALAQPALFAVEYALAQLWMSWGIRPQALAGHSLGEYVAACLAGVFSLEDALALVAERGRLMGGLPSGVMLSVPLGEEEIAPLLAPFAGRLSLAAVNEPSRSVVSGPEEAMAELERELLAHGVDGRRLHTSHAFHSAMMEPILSTFAERVRRVRRNPPQIPWLSNLTGTWITAEQAVDPEAWARQLRSPVRFAALLGELASDPERIFLEVGPGRTLATFARRVAPGNLTVTLLRAPAEGVEAGGDQETLLAALGRLWLAGVEMDWSGFHGDETRRRVPLPTYPFERQRYWIEGQKLALPAAAPEISKRSAIDDWFYVPVWSGTPAPRPVQPGDLSEDPRRRWLLVLDQHGLGASLAARLVEEGREVVTVESGSADTYAALLRDLAAADRLPQAVVHAASADPVSTFDAAQQSGFLSLVGLSRALAGVGLGTEKPVEIWVLTDRAHRVTGTEEMSPAVATVFGACRVIPQEMPMAVCPSVDLDLATEAAPARRLLAEIAAGPAERPVAWRGGRRWLQSFEPVRLEAHGRPLHALRERGVYLITGGLEGNGFGVARFLAETVGARLVLPESVPLPEAKAARVLALEQAGAEVLVVEADLTDEAALAWTVSQAVERFGALHGAIHAAAVVGERTFRPLADTGAEEAGWHFAPRALGLIALDAALTGRELDFRLALSSLAAVLGGVGYAAYAASHLFVDAFAQATAGRADGGWLAVGLDLWDLGGAAGEPDAAAVSASLADLAMTPAEGGEVLRRILAAATSEVVEVSTADLAARRARTGRRSSPVAGGGGAGGGGAARHSRPQHLQTAYAAPESDLERRIAAVWQELLGFADIGVDDNFFELGGDSFIAVRVAAKLREALGTDLPVAELYQRLTVRSLAELLGRDAGEATAELAAHLDERRESMDRRKEMLRRRRERKETVET
jgi:phthiocerol/phenolphthiocerol synthesis type-I polyketide synthase E